MQMMVLLLDGDGASGVQPESESTPSRLMPSSSPALSSSSLSLEEELSSSVELSAQHPERALEHSETLMESRVASMNVK